MAAEVITMYQEVLPSDIWPELNPLQCWDGSALVFSEDDAEPLADALVTLANDYDEKAEGNAPTSDGEPRGFCRWASLGLGTAYRRVLTG